jgi:hypothetical protein
MALIRQSEGVGPLLRVHGGRGCWRMVHWLACGDVDVVKITSERIHEDVRVRCGCDGYMTNVDVTIGANGACGGAKSRSSLLVVRKRVDGCTSALTQSLCLACGVRQQRQTEREHAFVCIDANTET